MNLDTNLDEKDKIRDKILMLFPEVTKLNYNTSKDDSGNFQTIITLEFPTTKKFQVITKYENEAKCQLKAVNGVISILQNEKKYEESLKRIST